LRAILDADEGVWLHHTPLCLTTSKRMKGFEPSTFAMARPERVVEARRYGRSDGP
jgi:hypothetical protein